jgi:hypothetical protein
VSQCAKVPATFYCRFYYLGSFGKSGEKRLLEGETVLALLISRRDLSVFLIACDAGTIPHPAAHHPRFATPWNSP